MSRFIKIIMTMLFVLGLIAAPFAGARAEKGDLSVLDKIEAAKDSDITNIMLGKAEMVTLPGNVSDVLIANPNIVDVMAVKVNQLYLVGSALGDTNIMVLDQDGAVLKKINIHVQMDTDKLESMIESLYPDEDVKIKALSDQLVLTGNVSTPAVSNAIANLVGRYVGDVKKSDDKSVDEQIVNMLSVAGEEQVMLKVRIVEAARNALKDLGLETRIGDSSRGALSGSLGAATGLGLASPVQLGVLALNYNLGGDFGPLNFLARALEEEGIVNTLAEPNLTAISGEQAGFLAGGEIPIPTEKDRDGNLVYQFRPFGVSLNFRPTVMSKNRISMELTTEVSNVSYSDNLQLQGVNIPTFNVRRADTTVELPSGGTLMIAGLLQSDTLSSLSQIPGVKKVPVVGDLLKSDSFRRNETELVVMVTPYLVRPFAQNHAAQSPQEPTGAPKKLSQADLKDVPRLSMSDLGDVPSETPVKPVSKVAKAPVKKDDIETAYDIPKEPVREKSQLSKTFESNIKRTYGAKRIDSVTKDMGSFGYMTD